MTQLPAVESSVGEEEEEEALFDDGDGGSNCMVELDGGALLLAEDVTRPKVSAHSYRR